MKQLKDIKVPCFTCQREFPITEMIKETFVYHCPECNEYYKKIGLRGQILKVVEEGVKWSPINQRGE